ncbi:S8 family peptidase [Flavivirga algicola]|uniref:S8 family serine peptidase n=1 Tax=Flavivirga algicola TaxID=2729136 RepID=A0ABX1RYX7_9FLAO|nr:S8 family serine peptidase [Flavivirga algicola]NMH88781.1 S8 family serine peptidase [Flavivirga algicola]
MKPHLIIKLNKINQVPQFKYWENLIENKQGVSKNFVPSIDRVVRGKYNIDFFVSNNYQPKEAQWSEVELKNDLNKVYRLILLTNNPDIPEGLIEEIKILPEVAFVKKGQITTSNIPDQQYSDSQSLSSKYIKNAIYLKEAHKITMGHPDVKIAVLDTGIETGHSEFDNQFRFDKDFVNIIDGASQFVGDFLDMDDVPDDLVGHGTHVAGIIASKGRKMPIGVSPKCQIIPVKVLGALKDKGQVVGAGLIDDIDAGIKYAVDKGADVINMSLGIKHHGGGLPHEDIIAYALDSGVSVVAASGNDGKKDKYYPGALKGVIAVGASDYIGHIAPFSTFGGHVSVTAPGVNVYSTFLNNGYAMSSGTSQASPFVSGTIALLKSYAIEKGKTIKNEDIIYILKQTCDKYSNRYKDEKSGFGRINILDALKMLRYNL